METANSRNLRDCLGHNVSCEIITHMDGEALNGDEGRRTHLCKHSTPRHLSTHEIAAEVGRMLVNAGCTIHRCDAETSESAYLIVDGGIVGGIRISEHKGRPSAPYRYNIGAFVDTTHTTHGRIERTFYTLDDMRRLVADVIAEHEANVAEYGERKYSKMVHRALVDEESEWHDVLTKCRTLDEHESSCRNGDKAEASDKPETRQGRAREIIHDIGNGFKYVDDAVCGNKRKRTRILYQHNYRCACGQF